MADIDDCIVRSRTSFPFESFVGAVVAVASRVRKKKKNKRTKMKSITRHKQSISNEKKVQRNLFYFHFISFDFQAKARKK